MIPLCSPQQARLPTALAIGSFDGIHAGHRRVIESITTDGAGIPTVLSFWPHPREVLYGETRLRLDLPSEKTVLLGPLGVEQLVLVPFSSSLAELSPQEFVEEILIKTLAAKRIAIGANFRFGKDRTGDVDTLKKYASLSGAIVSVLPIIEDSEGRMSSSRIRRALNEGNLNRAKTLLGRPYTFQGRVVRGRGLGKSIGWPTANLEVDGRKFLPGKGVYACFAWINNNKLPRPAVMNLGPQPTVDPNSPSAVEVHILDDEVNLNKSHLAIEPVKKLRSQEKFSNLESLSKQIKIDADIARSILNDLIQSRISRVGISQTPDNKKPYAP